LARGRKFVWDVVPNCGKKGEDDAEDYDSQGDENQDGLGEWFLTVGIGHGVYLF